MKAGPSGGGRWGESRNCGKPAMDWLLVSRSGLEGREEYPKAENATRRNRMNSGRRRGETGLEGFVDHQGTKAQRKGKQRRGDVWQWDEFCFTHRASAGEGSRRRPFVCGGVTCFSFLRRRSRLSAGLCLGAVCDRCWQSGRGESLPCRGKFFGDGSWTVWHRVAARPDHQVIGPPVGARKG
jgi:hypothetical protein